MNVEEKGVVLFGLIAVLALATLLVFPDRMTGGQVFVECPAPFAYENGYCVDPACHEVSCTTQGNFIMPPDCVCIRYIDRILCGIKGSEKTGIKSPDCTRQGQLDRVCGYYNASGKVCVLRAQNSST